MAKDRRGKRGRRVVAMPTGPAGGLRWQTVGLATALFLIPLIYGALFFAVPEHRAVGWLWLVPDELLREWRGGSWSRVELADRFSILVLAGLLQLSALGYGWIALRILGWPSARLGCRLIEWPLAAALGLGTHSVATVGAGWLGLLHLRWLFWVAVLASIPWCGVAGWNVWSTRRRMRNAVWSCKPWTIAAVVVFSGLAVYLTLAALLPPSAFDVREYHLQVPKEWYQQGRVTFMSHNVYGNMPLGSEMAALEAMVLWGGEDGWWWGALTGKLTMGLYSVWCGVLLAGLGGRERGVSGGWLVAALWLATPWVMRVSTAGLNEGCLALFYLGAVVSVWQALRGAGSARRANRWWGTAAALAGFACGVKYPAVLFLWAPLGVVVAILVGWRLAERRVLAWVVLLAALAGGIWYVKNLALSGNPVYPLAARWLDGRTRTPERIAQWERAHQVPVDSRGRRYTAEQLGRSLATLAWQSRWLAPALMPLACLGILRTWRRRETWYLAGVLALWFGLWFFATHRIERFMVPGMPLVAWLALLNWTRPWPGRWQWVPAAIAAFGLAYGAVASMSRMTGDNRILVALSDLRDDLPREEDPGMSRTNPIHVWLNRQAPREAQEAVLLIGDAQPFDLEMPVFYNTCFDATWLERWLAGVSDTEACRQRLRDHGIRYVVVDWDEIERYRRTYGYSDAITRQWVVDELWRQRHVYEPTAAPTRRNVMVFEVRH